MNICRRKTSDKSEFPPLRRESLLSLLLSNRSPATWISTKCDNSLQRAFSYCVLLFVSTRFAGNPVRCISMFGWCVATHYPMLLGSRMRDEAGALNVAGSDVFG